MFLRYVGDTRVLLIPVAKNCCRRIAGDHHYRAARGHCIYNEMDFWINTECKFNDAPAMLYPALLERSLTTLTTLMIRKKPLMIV